MNISFSHRQTLPVPKRSRAQLISFPNPPHVKILTLGESFFDMFSYVSMARLKQKAIIKDVALPTRKAKCFGAIGDFVWEFLLSRALAGRVEKSKTSRCVLLVPHNAAPPSQHSPPPRSSSRRLLHRSANPAFVLRHRRQLGLPQGEPPEGAGGR